MRYDDVTVKQTDEGWETLLPKSVCNEIGITKALEKGPIVFGHGSKKVTLRPIEGDLANRAGFTEPQTSNR